MIVTEDSVPSLVAILEHTLVNCWHSLMPFQAKRARMSSSGMFTGTGLRHVARQQCPEDEEELKSERASGQHLAWLV